jgi:hypothetical protein
VRHREDMQDGMQLNQECSIPFSLGTDMVLRVALKPNITRNVLFVVKATIIGWILPNIGYRAPGWRRTSLGVSI